MEMCRRCFKVLWQPSNLNCFGLVSVSEFVLFYFPPVQRVWAKQKKKAGKYEIAVAGGFNQVLHHQPQQQQQLHLYGIFSPVFFRLPFFSGLWWNCKSTRQRVDDRTLAVL